MKLMFEEHELRQLVVEALQQRGYAIANALDAVAFKDGSDDFIWPFAFVEVGDLPEQETEE